MSEETKQNIKEAVIEALEPFAQSIQESFQMVNGRLDKMDARFDGIDGHFDNIENRLSKVEIELAGIKSDVQVIKENSSELFTKLDEFISLYRKQEQELLIMGNQLRRLEERINKLEAQRQ